MILFEFRGRDRDVVEAVPRRAEVEAVERGRIEGHVVPQPTKDTVFSYHVLTYLPDLAGPCLGGAGRDPGMPLIGQPVFIQRL